MALDKDTITLSQKTEKDVTTLEAVVKTTT